MLLMTQKLHSGNKYVSLKTRVTEGEVINGERCHLQATETRQFVTVAWEVKKLDY